MAPRQIPSATSVEFLIKSLEIDRTPTPGAVRIRNTEKTTKFMV
jgi:hypothetical protein